MLRILSKVVPTMELLDSKINVQSLVLLSATSPEFLAGAKNFSLKFNIKFFHSDSLK